MVYFDLCSFSNLKVGENTRNNKKKKKKKTKKGSVCFCFGSGWTGSRIHRSDHLPKTPKCSHESNMKRIPVYQRTKDSFTLCFFVIATVILLIVTNGLYRTQWKYSHYVTAMTSPTPVLPIIRKNKSQSQSEKKTYSVNGP